MTDTEDRAPTLDESLDAFAQSLLEKAKASDSLPDMLKAFETVGRYAEQKAKATPPPPDKPAGKKGSKFEHIRAEFNGSPQAPRRARRTAPAEVEPVGNA